MKFVGELVIYLIMISAFLGCAASIINEESELGNQFLAGVKSIGDIFLPVAGIMASAPYLTKIVHKIFGNIYSVFGADPSMAATTFIAVDMGGYQLAKQLAATNESWIMAMLVGYTAGATIVFSIPVALKMIKKEDREYLAMGIMAGFITIPVGVLISSIILMVSKPFVREEISTSGEMTYRLLLNSTEIIKNVIPLFIICILITLGLYFKPNQMIKGFSYFGKVMDSILKIVFVLCVIEYFTGIFSRIFNIWGFDPIIADEKDINRALEVSGYIGIMLCGAFPMVYLIKKYLEKPLNYVGNKFNLSTDTTTGILTASANVLALFAILETMKPEDKIRTVAFSVCGAFLIGDHLAFTANYQPTLLLPILIGKLGAGVLAIVVANKLIIPKLKEEKLEEALNYNFN